MFGFFAYEKILGVPESVIWNEHYHDPRWQTFFDLFNSIPLIILGMLGAYAARSTLLGVCICQSITMTVTGIFSRYLTGDLKARYPTGIRPIMAIFFSGSSYCLWRRALSG